MFYGQAEQDKFVLEILKYKKNGYFLELGSHHPININNTFLLESKYDWQGIMIERKDKWINDYKKHRPNSIHMIDDATKINYKDTLQKYKFPKNIDYLQIDLEPTNGSTLNALKKIKNEIMDEFKFATITFEHDIWRTNNYTRTESRKIFSEKGYILVFTDVNNDGNPYEDWYVHPDIVDMTYVNDLINKNKDNFKNNNIVQKSINWKDIKY
jgi:hypothetical protein